MSVGVGSENHEIWAVHSDHTIVRREGVTHNNQEGTNWVEVDGYLAQVSVGNWHVWGVNRFHELYERVGVSADNVNGDSWTQRE